MIHIHEAYMYCLKKEYIYTPTSHLDLGGTDRAPSHGPRSLGYDVCGIF